MSVDSKRYLYGIIDLNGPKTFESMNTPAGEKVYCVPYKGIGCVVQEDDTQNNYLSMDTELLAHHLVHHQKMVEKIMSEHTIIPMKFGTCLNTDDEIIRMLENGQGFFADMLHTMEGKIELDVVAGWNDLKTIIKEIGAKDTAIADFKKEIAANPPEDMLQVSLQVGAMVKTALDEKRTSQQYEIIKRLSKSSLEIQHHDLMEDKMILNCAFLLNADKENTFDQALHDLDNDYDGKIDFRCVGPLPPYSFATCEVIRPNFKKTDGARRLLELDGKAYKTDIKEAYRKYIKREHPDQSDSSAGQKQFEAVKSAYKYLMDTTNGNEISFKEADINQLIIVRPFDVAGTRTFNR